MVAALGDAFGLEEAVGPVSTAPGESAEVGESGEARRGDGVGEGSRPRRVRILDKRPSLTGGGGRGQRTEDRG